MQKLQAIMPKKKNRDRGQSPRKDNKPPDITIPVEHASDIEVEVSSIICTINGSLLIIFPEQ
jgi:hypothetical protein